MVAPPALRFAALPAHTVPPMATVTVGSALTVTVDVFAELQEPEEPVTVYTVVDDGLTLMLVLLEPVFQV